MKTTFVRLSRCGQCPPLGGCEVFWSARSSIEETLPLANLLSIKAYKIHFKILRVLCWGNKVVETRVNGKMKISRSFISMDFDNHEWPIVLRNQLQQLLKKLKHKWIILSSTVTVNVKRLQGIGFRMIEHFD